MITTRRSFFIIVTVLLIYIMTLGLGLANATAESGSLETDDEWYGMDDVMRVNQIIGSRVQEFLETDETMLEWGGLCPSTWDWFEENYERIRREELQSFYVQYIPDFDIEEIIHRETVESEYNRHSDSILHTSYATGYTPDYQAVYQHEWDTILQDLRHVYDTEGSIALSYELAPYFDLRFEDGDTVHDYLISILSNDGETTVIDYNYLYLRFLENCFVNESGYLVHQDGDLQRTVLAWFESSLRKYAETHFDEADLAYLPPTY